MMCKQTKASAVATMDDTNVLYSGIYLAEMGSNKDNSVVKFRPANFEINHRNAGFTSREACLIGSVVETTS